MALTTVNPALLDTQAQYTGFKNRIINGGMGIWQRGTAFTGISTNIYTADRFTTNLGNLNGGVFRVDQSTDVPTGQGFPFSLRLSPTTVISSVLSNTFASIVQLVEGFNCSDFAYGTASASPTVLSYWVKSNITGIMPGTIILNAAANGTERCYPFVYTITTADTWQKITIPVSGDITGLIANNNTWGLQINLGYLAIGSSFQSGVVNTWNTNSGGNQYIASGNTYINRASNTANYLSFTGVQLEKGSTATSFDYRPYGTELALCQRYYQTFYPAAQELIYNEASTANAKWWQLYLPAPMRSAPTATYSSGMTGGIVVGLSGTISSLSLISASVNRVSTRVTMSTASGTAYNVHHCDGFDGDSVGLASEL
jgi:hypothetical protein